MRLINGALIIFTVLVVTSGGVKADEPTGFTPGLSFGTVHPTIAGGKAEFPNEFAISIIFDEKKRSGFGTRYAVDYFNTVSKPMSDQEVQFHLTAIPVFFDGLYRIPVGQAVVYGGAGVGLFLNYHKFTQKNPGLRESFENLLRAAFAFIPSGELSGRVVAGIKIPLSNNVAFTTEYTQTWVNLNATYAIDNQDFSVHDFSHSKIQAGLAFNFDPPPVQPEPVIATASVQ